MLLIQEGVFVIPFLIYALFKKLDFNPGRKCTHSHTSLSNYYFSFTSCQWRQNVVKLLKMLHPQLVLMRYKIYSYHKCNRLHFASDSDQPAIFYTLLQAFIVTSEPIRPAPTAPLPPPV